MGGMFFGHLCMALAPKQLLLGTIIIGFSFGGIFGTAPVFVAETFGKPHFGKQAVWCVFSAGSAMRTGVLARFCLLCRVESGGGCLLITKVGRAAVFGYVPFSTLF
jgi:hypothetical protein